MAVKEITHPLMGRLIPVQGPYATYMSDNDDFDLSLYIDGPAWMVKLDLDYHSYVSGQLETVEKEFVLDANYLEKYGRGWFVNRMEELFDGIAAKQLTYIDITTVIDIREHISTLMEEAFQRLDSEATETAKQKLRDILR
jgi:hypothetical protein